MYHPVGSDGRLGGFSNLLLLRSAACQAHEGGYSHEHSHCCKHCIFHTQSLALAFWGKSPNYICADASSLGSGVGCTDKCLSMPWCHSRVDVLPRNRRLEIRQGRLEFTSTSNRQCGQWNRIRQQL